MIYRIWKYWLPMFAAIWCKFQEVRFTHNLDFISAVCDWGVLVVFTYLFFVRLHYLSAQRGHSGQKNFPSFAFFFSFLSFFLGVEDCQLLYTPITSLVSVFDLSIIKYTIPFSGNCLFFIMMVYIDVCFWAFWSNYDLAKL